MVCEDAPCCGCCGTSLWGIHMEVESDYGYNNDDFDDDFMYVEDDEDED